MCADKPNKPGWAVELVGDKFDLDDFREQLAPPFNPWVEEYEANDGSRLLLRSENWTHLTEATAVLREASRFLERLNGAMLLIHPDAKAPRLGQIMRFGPDGKGERILFPITGQLKVTMPPPRLRAKGLVGRQTASPQPSKLQRWFSEAEVDDTYSDLFVHLLRSDNWYDLYKATELAKNLAKSKGGLKAILGPDYRKWSSVQQTANHFRHAPDPMRYPLPSSPPKFPDAKEFVLRVLPQLLP